MIFQLGKKVGFPDPRLGEEDGLLAVGGELTLDWLLVAYNYGIFPWFSFRDWDSPAWFCPMQRFVIFPDEIHISHSMRTLMSKHRYKVSYNTDFEGVIDGCSMVDDRYYSAGAWLGEDIKRAYTELHDKGYAASVEVWNEQGELAGGLYGVQIRRCFIGESMFSREPNTSKLALIHLALFMQRIGGKMIDCQLETNHLRSMGGRFIPYEEYLTMLNPDALTTLKKLPASSPDDDSAANDEQDKEAE